jgi:uncharacterized Ntn-hydrolase superfamily protein
MITISGIQLAAAFSLQRHSASMQTSQEITMTYSIVTRDPETGEIGVAVETALPGVGRICPWAQAGVGAVATQALSRISHGDSGLILMRNGHTAPEALTAVLAGDPGAQVRQVGMVDAHGNAASHTGSKTIRFAGHHVGEGYAVQANMMLTDTVPAAMAKAFENSSGRLVQRMIAAMKAAQAEGGDFRGQQSAALLIVSGTLMPQPWQGVLFDVRVDDHPTPVEELERICNRQLSYQLSYEASDLAAGDNADLEKAMQRYQEAVTLDPDELQMRFWFALDMADKAKAFDVAEPIFREVFAKDPMWAECLVRFADTNRLNDDGLVDRILALKP